MTEISNLLAVLFLITITIILPPLFSVIWLYLGGQWPKIILVSLVLGLSSQSVIGLLWNHLVSRDPRLEALLYYLFWLILFLVIMVFHKKSLSMKIGRRAIIGTSMIIGLLMLAVIVRSIHPLQHFALGQSDAYSHLNFLRDIIETGAIENKMYPPGYHWVLALPVLSFHLDPYNVARYVGAFFGAGLVLAVFVLVEEAAGRKAAYLSAFGVACFPGFYLLLKTGVGAFANQMGLFFIPVALYYYIRVLEEKSVLSSCNLIFILSLLGLAASVPMMLFHILIIIFMERVLSLLYGSHRWLIQTIGITLRSLPAIFLVAYHFLRTGEQAQKVNIQILNESVDKASSVLLEKFTFLDLLNQPLLRSILDFLSIKRWGFGNILMDSTGFLILLISLVFLLYSISKKKCFYVMFALWGVIASTQAITGFLQFSAYQREGWSLLIFIACVSGMLLAHIYERWIVQRIILQWCFFICVFIVSLVSIIFPPAHRFYASASEDDIIRIVRRLTDQSAKKLPFELKTETQGCETLNIRNNLSEHLPIVIVSRNFSSWGSGQGELIKVVMHRNTSIRNVTVTDQTVLHDVFKKENQYLIFIDKEKEIGLDDLGIASHLSRFNARQFVIAQSNLLQTNKKIEDYLNHLSSREWNLHQVEINDNLTIKILKPFLMSS